MLQTINVVHGPGRMGRASKKAPTHPVRVYKDLAELLHMLAPVFGQDVSDFIDAPLRKFAESMREEAARRVMGKDHKSRKGKDPHAG